MPVPFSSKENSSISIDQIEKFENDIGMELPASYKEFLMKYNVATPESNKISTPIATTSIKVFFGFSNTPVFDIRNELETFKGRMPPEALPIASTATGDIICLQLKTGAAFLWDHENEPEEPSYDNMIPLAPSFPDLIESLEPRSASDQVDVDAAKVISTKLKPGFADKFKDYIKK